MIQQNCQGDYSICVREKHFSLYLVCGIVPLYLSFRTSHVANLKNRIDRQIVVTKDRQGGSRAEIIA